MNVNEIIKKLEANDYIAKPWEKGGHTRVYVSRHLSRGRQEMGYIELLDNGDVQYYLSRAKATIRDIVEK